MSAKKIAIVSSAVLFGLLAVTEVSAGTHCEFGGHNTWNNEYRNSILKAAGYLTVKPDNTTAWTKSFPMVNGYVTCVFQADVQGQLKYLAIKQSSGDRRTDEKALQFIRAAAPFKVKSPITEIQIASFESNDLIIEEVSDAKSAPAR